MIKLQVLEARMGTRAKREIKLDAGAYYGKIVERVQISGAGGDTPSDTGTGDLSD